MIVLDACAAVEMVRQSDEGLALQQLVLRNEKIISCDLLRAEVASVFRKLARTEALSSDLATRYYSEALALVDEFRPMDDLGIEALRESIRLNHSAYDLFYFILARRTGATLFTTDRRLMRLCREHGVDCVDEIELDE